MWTHVILNWAGPTRMVVAGGSTAASAPVHDANVLGQGRTDELELEDGRIQAAKEVTSKVQHPLYPYAIRSQVLLNKERRNPRKLIK